MDSIFIKNTNIHHWYFLGSSSDNGMDMISNVTIQHFSGVGINLGVNHDTTLIRNSLVTNISRIGVSVSGDGCILNLINNTFQHNGESTQENSAFASSVNLYVLFHVKENVFENNDVNKVLKFSIPAYARSILNIVNNDFLNNTCGSLVDIEYTGSSCGSLSACFLAYNRWRNNHVLSTCLVLK